MNCWIFLADNETEQECLNRNLFGTTLKGYEFSNYFRIQVGDPLLLYNYKSCRLWGPFYALTNCRKDIEPNAWKDFHRGGYPYQVRVSSANMLEKPVYKKEGLEDLIEFELRKGFPKPRISVEQLKMVLHLLRISNGAPIQDSGKFYSHYIFKCDRITGGRVFHENLFGAPATLFRNIVSNIQEGDYIFLWLIEEMRLYGVWKAKSRGQYDPTAFPEAAGKYPAVVYASRFLQTDKFLSNAELRSILPFDGHLPPYAINYETGQRIVEYFSDERKTTEQLQNPQASSSVTGSERQIRTEDGHYVRSQAEARIDDWLYNHNIAHSYEEQINLGTAFIRCDFYLKGLNIFIEYWGLMGNSEYERKRLEKLKIYKHHNLKLIELFRDDIDMLSEIMKSKLSAFGHDVF